MLASGSKRLVDGLWRPGGRGVIDMAEPHRLAAPVQLQVIEQRVSDCLKCPDLRSYCRTVAARKRKSFASWEYWGRPVPSFGDRHAKLLIVGLAPAAHGANRTGRMFTGDRSGDFLYAALHRAGLANQPTSQHVDDGLELRGVYITAAAHCAPPANKPSPVHLRNCAPYLVDEVRLLQPRAIICLGAIAWNAALDALRQTGESIPKPRPKFAHGATCPIGRTTLIGSYHVSQQNTFTGRLTPRMLDEVIELAKAIVKQPRRQTASVARPSRS